MSNLKEDLFKLLQLAKESVYADITANSCQTQRDFDDAREAEGAYEDALESFLKKIERLEHV